MRNRRLAVVSMLICLPVVMVITAIGWGVIAEVPKAIRYEPVRIGREYREIAESLFEHPERATYRGERRKGWRQTGRINGMPWGYVLYDGRTLVWHQVGERQYQALEVDAIEPVPYALIGYGGGLVVIVMLIVLAVVCVTNIFRTVRERDDFLAATAHDLTTPLVGMRMTIGRDPDEARRLVERMLLIVANLREFMRLGGRRREPEIEKVDMAAVCREAYRLFRDDYLDILGEEVPIDARTDNRAMADPTLLTQVFWNLFCNDLKYAAPYGKVRVVISGDGNKILAEFIDEGKGMSASQMRHAFDRYYRAKTALESGCGGFGIGLCTARELVRSMGGELSVRANEPSGCVFTLSLSAAL